MNFEWDPDTFRILGIEFTVSLIDITDINIKNNIDAITNSIRHWSNRNLTPLGRITVIKSILISKIVHILTSLPNPSKVMMKRLHTILYNFLWKGKPDPIKRIVSRQNYQNGGIKMIDLDNFIKAIKLTWIRRLLKNQNKWQNCILSILPELKFIEQCGDEYSLYISSKTENVFWKEIFLIFNEYTRMFQPKTIIEFDSQSFLFNSKIRINKQSIKFRELLFNKVVFINQLKLNGKFLTYEQFINKYPGIQLNFIHYNAIIQSIDRYYKSQNFNPSRSVQYNQQPHIHLLLRDEKGASRIYKKLIEVTKTPTGINRWAEKEFDMSNWNHMFKILHQITNDNNLIWLQTRILHHILTTNKTVSKYDPQQTNLCTFCKHTAETIEHLFWSCQVTSNFWRELQTRINSRCKNSHNFHFNIDYVLFGVSNNLKTDKVIDLLNLQAKHFIYLSKVKSVHPNLTAFSKIFFKRYKIEKTIANNSQKTKQFEITWFPYLDLFRGIL